MQFIKRLGVLERPKSWASILFLVSGELSAIGLDRGLDNVGRSDFDY